MEQCVSCGLSRKRTVYSDEAQTVLFDAYHGDQGILLFHPSEDVGQYARHCVPCFLFYFYGDDRRCSVTS